MEGCCPLLFHIAEMRFLPIQSDTEGADQVLHLQPLQDLIKVLQSPLVYLIHVPLDLLQCIVCPVFWWNLVFCTCFAVAVISASKKLQTSGHSSATVCNMWEQNNKRGVRQWYRMFKNGCNCCKYCSGSSYWRPW